MVFKAVYTNFIFFFPLGSLETKQKIGIVLAVWSVNNRTTPCL